MEVNDLTFTQELNDVVNIGIIGKSKDVVVGDARLLLCCNCVKLTNSKIPENFDGDSLGVGGATMDHDMVDEDFYHLPGQVIHVGILFDEVAPVVALLKPLVELLKFDLCGADHIPQIGSIRSKDLGEFDEVVVIK